MALSCLSRIRVTWLRSYSYLHNPGKEPLQYITLGQVLEKSAREFEDRVAVISNHQKKELTYREALEQCDQFAAGLLNIGLKKGDRVGLWCPNILEWFIVKYACARAGLILVALNPHYQAPEMEYAIHKVGIKCLICTDKVKKMNYHDILNKLIPNLDKSAVGKINSTKLPSLKSIITVSDKTVRWAYNFQEIVENSDQSLIQSIRKNQNSISPDDAFSILFSSGTTGKPKAAIVSHFSHVNNTLLTGGRMELGIKSHRICMMVPFFHAFGVNITTGSSVCYGSTIVVPSITYSPSDNLTAIKEQKCTMIHGTPTMHLDLITEQRKRNENISAEIAVSGGSPISTHQFRTMLDVFKVKSVKSVYGLTETTAVVFASKPGDDEEKSTSTVGYVGDHMEAKVVDENGMVVPFGIPGELCIRGYANMIGYWDDMKKTEATIGRDNWLKTGDRAILSADGYAKIVGRNKDMIIRGGENIFPKEVEDILITHPDIAEVQVIGLPHERLGEEVCACVKMCSDKILKLEEIVTFCEGKMAYFKIPRQLRIVDSFPRTISGKIQKYLLVEKFAKTL
ncbi:hypothetical protein HHI36_008720 [Cryptolaemus montrouzieri]|uniref:Medium-chain acyl-CoA ligase ACSF2, mitochondrial n=1 Tax=Cryptolaemus montrouzieri TaxID=559131 RepID=A0ABD2MTK8_9CUCU